MENIKDYIQNYILESKSRLIDIEEYGESLINDWGSDYCGNILSMFIQGVKTGMENNKADDAKFQKRCLDCINELLNNINEKIY